MSELPFHPLADIFPMLGPKELSALADDIAAHGQRDPIILLDDMILDGRNRYLCTAQAEFILRGWINCRSGVSKKIKLTGTLPTLDKLGVK